MTKHTPSPRRERTSPPRKGSNAYHGSGHGYIPSDYVRTKITNHCDPAIPGGYKGPKTKTYTIPAAPRFIVTRGS